MEAVEELRSWWKVPCIAHFCSLFRGVLFEQSDLDIEDLEEALISATSPCDSPIILDLLCSLLEGIYGREQLTVVDYDRYMKDLFCHHHDAGNIKTNPLVDKTYFELSLHDKVEVLHSLCDFRLDAEDVMEVLKGHDGDNMRVEPLGHDLNGATYWYFYGTRLYQEDPAPKDPKEKEKLPRHVKHSKMSKKKKKTEREERAKKRKTKKKDEGPKTLRKSKRYTKKSLLALENEEQTAYDNEDEGFEENYNQEEELSDLESGTKFKSAFVNKPVPKDTQESVNADAVDNRCDCAEEIKSTVTNTLSDIKVKIEKNEFATKKETLAERVSGIIEVKVEEDNKLSELKDEEIIDEKNIETTDFKHGTTDAKGIHVEVKDEIKCENDEEVKAIVDKVVDDVIHEVEKQNDNKLNEISHEEAVSEPEKPEEAVPKLEKAVTEPEEAVPEPEKTDEAVIALGEIEPEYEEVVQEFEVETAYKDDEEVVEKEANDMELLDDSVASIDDSKSEGEKMVEVIKPRHVSRWHMVCSTLEDWQNLSEFFCESEAKCEKALYRTIVEDFLPEIPNIIIEREKELTRRLMQSMPRRQSSRLEVKRIQQEELEKLQAQQEAGEEKQKAIEDDKRMERVRQARVEDQKRAREERERVREERANRIKKKEERARLLAEGIEVPEELQNLDSPVPEAEVRVQNLTVNNEVTITMYKVLDAIKSHRDSWLFWEPVEETFAPGYFDVVKNPIDLMRIESKVNNREYNTTDDFFDDLHRMFDNCILYNGSDSDYAYMSQTLRTHLKKVYKRLLPKEEDLEPPPEQPKVAKKTVADDPSFSPAAPYVYKPKARRKTQDYHCVYEKQVYKDMVKCPPTSSGTFKHGNYMVRMAPAMRESKQRIFDELDKEMAAYKSSQSDKKYTKLPMLATYPVKQENRPLIDPEDSLAGRFKRKVDQNKVLATGTPKVETIASPDNPAVKKNIWHISQEDMIKYRKIAQENNGMVEIKGPDGKILKLQFKSAPKPLCESSTTTAPAIAPALVHLNMEKEVQNIPQLHPVVVVADKPVEETVKSDGTAGDEMAVPNTASSSSSSAESTDSNDNKPPSDIPPDTNDNQTDTFTEVKPVSEIDETNQECQRTCNNGEVLKSATATDDEDPEKSLEIHSISTQAEVDYEDYKKSVELINGNQKKPKYTPFRKKQTKAKTHTNQQSLEILEKKLREGHSVTEITGKTKKPKEMKSNVIKNKSKNLNGVIIRGVHHQNGVKRKHIPANNEALKNESANKGDDSDFDDEDDIPLKKLWHPVQQSPDKMKLVICRGRKDSDTETPQSELSPISPKPGILKKLGTFDNSPWFTKINKKNTEESTHLNKSMAESTENVEQPPKKKKRVSFSDKLSVRNFSAIASNDDHDQETGPFMVPVPEPSPVPPSRKSPPKNTLANEKCAIESPSLSISIDPALLTTMQHKIKQLKSESISHKYVCDFDSDDGEELPPPIKPSSQVRPVISVLPKRPCSYLKTSSYSTLLNKPHEFSVNAPHSVVSKVGNVFKKSQVESVNIQTEKTGDPVTQSRKDICVGAMEVEIELPKKPNVRDAAVETKDLSPDEEIDVNNLDKNVEQETEIDPVDKKRAESLIKTFVEEYQYPQINNPLISKKKRAKPNLQKKETRTKKLEHSENIEDVHEFAKVALSRMKNKNNSYSTFENSGDIQNYENSGDIQNYENSGDIQNFKNSGDIQNFEKVDKSENINTTINSENIESIENADNANIHKCKNIENVESIDSVKNIHIDNSENIHIDNSENIHIDNSENILFDNSENIHIDNSENVHINIDNSEKKLNSASIKNSANIKCVKTNENCQERDMIEQLEATKEHLAEQTEIPTKLQQSEMLKTATKKFAKSLVADYTDDDDQSENESQNSEQLEDLPLNKKTLKEEALPTLDKELPLLDNDMPTLEAFNDSSMPQLFPAYEEEIDHEEKLGVVDDMPILEENPDIKNSVNKLKRDQLTFVCEKSSTDSPQKTIETSPKASVETSPKISLQSSPKTTSEKKYRDREHPFFNDPAMIILYSPDSPSQPKTAKANLMDSFMKLGRSENSSEIGEIQLTDTSSSISSSDVQQESTEQVSPVADQLNNS